MGTDGAAQRLLAGAPARTRAWCSSPLAESKPGSKAEEAGCGLRPLFLTFPAALLRNLLSKLSWQGPGVTLSPALTEAHTLLADQAGCCFYTDRMAQSTGSGWWEREGVPGASVCVCT